MKYIIITDCKPESCETCPLHTDIIAQDDAQNNMLNIVSGCSLSNKPDGNTCPLLEDKNYLDNLDTTQDFVLFMEGE